MTKPTAAASAAGLLKALTASQKAGFLHAVLEPLTASELLDTAYNRDARKARRNAWSDAYWAMKYRNAAFNFLIASRMIDRSKRDADGEANMAQAEADALAEMRQTTADLIRTPAPTEEAVALKRRLAADRYLPISADEARAAIEADAAFLAAHPITRHPRRRCRPQGKPQDIEGGEVRS